MHIGEDESIDLADLSGSDPGTSTDRHTGFSRSGHRKSTGTVVIGFKRDSRSEGAGDGDEISVTPFVKAKGFE